MHGCENLLLHMVNVKAVFLDGENRKSFTCNLRIWWYKDHEDKSVQIILTREFHEAICEISLYPAYDTRIYVKAVRVVIYIFHWMTY